MLRRILNTLLIMLLWPATLTPLPALSQVEEADMLRAAFVYNFAKYVTWPANTLDSEEFELCLTGSGYVVQGLQRLKGQTVQQRKVKIRTLQFGDNLDSCHMLFVGLTEKSRMGSLLKTLRDRPLLTVSDIPGFAEKGGVIEFFVEEKRLRFAINRAAAEQAGLAISARLLKLARIINGQPSK